MQLDKYERKQKNMLNQSVALNIPSSLLQSPGLFKRQVDNIMSDESLIKGYKAAAV